MRVAAGMREGHARRRADVPIIRRAGTEATTGHRTFGTLSNSSPFERHWAGTA
jgi:hypothetical protein